MRRSVTKMLLIGICLTMMAAGFSLPASAGPAADDPVSVKTTQSEPLQLKSTDSETTGYDQYQKTHENEPCPQQGILCDTKSITGEKKLEKHDGVSCAVLSGDTRSITYQVTVKEKGLYRLSVTYLPIPGKMKDIVFSLLIDKASPFHEAEAIALSRVFEDADSIKRDKTGNDIRPSQQEVSRFQTKELANTDGYYRSVRLVLLGGCAHDHPSLRRGIHAGFPTRIIGGQNAARLQSLQRRRKRGVGIPDPLRGGKIL